MKVIQLCPNLKQGGVERKTIEFSNFLKDEKDITNFICSNGGPLLSELDNSTTHFTLSIHRKNPISIIVNSFKLAKYVKENNIDIIHAHSRAPAWVGFFASKLAKTKFVTTYHGLYRHENIFKRAYSSPMRKGKPICIVSDFIGNHVSKVYGIQKNKMYKTYGSFNESRFSMENINQDDVKAIRKEYNLQKDDVVLCMVGRFSKIKGILELIDVLSKIKSKNWKLLLVGADNRKKANLTEDIKLLIAKHNLQDRVILTGNQNKPENFLAASDICLAMSVKPETFGLTPVEAQALGKMVIATKLGGHLETVLDNKTGFFVSHTDFNQWVDKIDYAINLSAKERNKLGQAGKKWVWSMFTLNKVCKTEIEMYRRITKTQ
ncbi:MAG: glycosyltransferase family 4 protein [Proteobacteria bacterium]|nr:glycosyltransferase family 4 protein [Pseudomonadota bacterium]